MRVVHSLVISLMGAGVCACSIHPLPRDVTGLSTAAIVAKIRCEARAAIVAHVGSSAKRREDYKKGGIGYDFTFTITENNNIGVDTSFLYPFTSGFGKFTLNAGLGNDRQRQSERKFMIVESFEELTADKTCDHHQVERENWMYPITGTIGLSEVIKTYIELDEPAQNKLGAFSDQLAFTTTISGSIKPKVQLNSLAGQFRLTEASGSLVGDRKDVHKVRIVLATDKTPEAKPRDEEERRRQDTRPREYLKDRIREELFNLRQRELELKIVP